MHFVFILAADVLSDDRSFWLLRRKKLEPLVRGNKHDNRTFRMLCTVCLIRMMFWYFWMRFEPWVSNLASNFHSEARFETQGSNLIQKYQNIIRIKHTVHSMRNVRLSCLLPRTRGSSFFLRNNQKLLSSESTSAARMNTKCILGFEY